MSQLLKNISLRMNVALLLVAAFGLVFFLKGRAPEFVTEQSLLQYMQDPGNGLCKATKQGGVEISAIYRPTDLLVAQELGVKAFSGEELSQYRSKYSTYAYFTLSFSKDNRDALYGTATSYGDFSENLQKLSFRLREYLQMTTSAQDTVHMADYHFSRMHGMGGSTQVLVAFDRQDIVDKEWVQLNLAELGFGAGRVNLRFTTRDLLSAPSIDFLNQGNSDQ
jgi:hypothetical protein